ncbi:MAG: HAD family hydrolase [Gemmatimonadaceae bacterium]
MTQLARPRAMLIDYGGTLVEELGYEPRGGVELLLSRAIVRPPGATLDAVLQRVNRVTREVAARRVQTHVETPWPALSRLIYDYFGVEFDEPLSALELDFWKATVTSRPMAGAAAALDVFHQHDIPIGVVSNSSFGPDVIRYELDRHGVGEHVSFVMVSAEYAVRKPNRLLFEIAASRIDADPSDIWFIGDAIEADVAGAQAAGMKSVWLRPAGDTAAGTADLVAADWPAIATAFLGTR